MLHANRTTSAVSVHNVTQALAGEISMRSVIFAFTLLLLGSATANAGCTCQCVDGQMQPLCENSFLL
jgi:hypothetical protein